MLRRCELGSSAAAAGRDAVDIDTRPELSRHELRPVLLTVGPAFVRSSNAARRAALRFAAARAAMALLSSPIVQYRRSPPCGTPERDNNTVPTNRLYVTLHA